MAAPGAVSEAVIYEEVKAWIARQEAFEAEHHQPAPLTNAQRKALEVLRLASSASSQTAPATGDVNYVGMLGEYRQKHPTFGELFYVEEASGFLAGGTIGRVCRVTIGETLAHETGHIESFPAAGYGLSGVDDKAPLFPTKKAAKHFAAKCALDWLVANKYTPPYPTRGVPITPPKTPLLKRPTQGTNNAPLPKRQATAHGIAAAAPAEEGTVAHEPAATTRPATELADNLCKDLNIVAPSYVIEPSPQGGANTFDGFPEFDDYGDEELIALRKGALVEGVAEKEKTRQAVAEKLLVLLRGIKEGRDAQLRELMNT